jgi:hypothetical protein
MDKGQLPDKNKRRGLSIFSIVSLGLEILLFLLPIIIYVTSGSPLPPILVLARFFYYFLHVWYILNSVALISGIIGLKSKRRTFAICGIVLSLLLFIPLNIFELSYWLG